MNAGVEIILERIKTNPEEFVSKGGGRIANGKWSRVLDNYSQHLDKEEYDAIKNAIDKAQQDNFTEEVMTILAEGTDAKSDEGKWGDPNPYLAKGMGLGGQTQGLTLTANGAGTGYQWANTSATGQTSLNANSLTLGDTTLSEAGLKQMLATHRAMREETKSKHWWNKSLPELFGRK